MEVKEVKSNETHASTYDNEQKNSISSKLLTKLDWRILPALMIVDTLSLLDRYAFNLLFTEIVLTASQSEHW